MFGRSKQKSKYLLEIFLKLAIFAKKYAYIMISIGYGVSNFQSMVRENRYYVDRTNYISHIEEIGSKFLFFLRPRRFGKSLFISTLEYYYGIQHKDKFAFLFGKYQIGKSPTPLANSYLVLKFEFSGINTTSVKNTERGFLMKVKSAANRFGEAYPNIFSPEVLASWLLPDRAEEVTEKIFSSLKESPYKIYLLIDEYDHFTNE